MRRFKAWAALGLLAVGSLFVGGSSEASSHREAPFITKNPKVDGTDFYMFQSYEASRVDGSGNSQYTTLIANYIPLQDAYGGPNYFSFDPEALYEIEIENSGDAVEDITFQFRFTNALNSASAKGVELNVGGKNNSVPTVQANITIADNPTPVTTTNETTVLNVQESYTINVVKGPRRGSAGAAVKCGTGGAACAAGDVKFRKPVDNIGSRTFGTGAAYATYANQHIHPIDLSAALPGCTDQGKVFVGQRQEGFKVNLGLIFDLVNAPLGTIIDPSQRAAFNGSAFDNTQDANVSTIALEVPTKCLTADGKIPTMTARPKLGGWTTASVRQARIINPQATYAKPTKEGGAWAQVSRLGMPLTNEVVIGIADKDRFNSSEPKDDAQFADYVTNPTLPQILQAIFGGASTPIFPAGTVTRTDLVDIFLKGVPTVNSTGSTAEMLRLNTNLPVKQSGAQTGGPYAGNPYSGLGAALCFDRATNCTPAGKTQTDCYTLADPVGACDPAGFPNGRRPGDDIVDIELTVLLGYFVPQATMGGAGLLHDAVLNEESQFDATFPYLKTPHSGDPQ